jgi:ABC-type antimicrobial peptide transport system permease subunit
MVLSGTSWNIAVGLVAGLILCLMFDKLASQWVTESSRDPVILGGVTLLLVAVAVIACVGPARRAASIDPMEAVRHE